jgi:hypothetical protein
MVPAPTLAVVVVAASLAAACARPTEPSVSPTPAIASVSARVPTGPGPAPRNHDFDAVAENSECERCHTEIASEWRGSLHRMAHVDPVVRRQLEREPFPFCVGCHAPEADPQRPVPESHAELGVGCVTCHVVEDRVVAASTPPADAREESPHAFTRTADFDGALACAGCHEFRFPATGAEGIPLLMQSTMSEHTRSPLSDRSCASCHMPSVGSPGHAPHRSHRFAASRDDAFVRSAIRVDETFADGTLRLTLHAGEVGHAFPTGDMLRRLVLELDVVDAEGRSVEHVEHAFQRHFGFVRRPFRAPRKVVVDDDRVGASTAPLAWSFTARARPEGGRVRYVLRYERVSDPTNGEGGKPLVDGSIVLREGSFGFATQK